MTIQYRNAGVSLTTTNLTTVLTISTSAVAIVKSVYYANSSTGSIICNGSLRDSSASTDFEFFRDNVSASTQVNASPQGLNLEAGDAIKMKAGTANEISGIVSYALINRSQQNG